MASDLENKAMKNTATNPEDCDRILLAALESGDIQTSVDLYEPSAVLFRKSGQSMTGHEEIRKNNEFLIALKPKFTIEFIKSTISGDGTLATNRMKAKMVGTNAEGKKIEGLIHTLEVVRKQADGSWRFIIDDPYGSMRDSMQER